MYKQPKITLLTRKLLPEAAQLMLDIHAAMPVSDRERYVPTDLECLYRKYDTDTMLSIGCLDEKNSSRLVAIAIFEVPTAEECYANYTDIAYPVEQCIHTENIVVSASYRGRHLQEFLIVEGERLVRKKFPNRIHALSTVHPDNIASMKNLKRAGYQCIKSFDIFPDPVYNGASRNIMYKNLAEN